VLLLRFRLGEDEYALDTSDVVTVLPVVELKTIPQAPDGVAGVFNYRGTPVPVVDLAQEATGLRARPNLHTRIVVVRDRLQGAGDRLLGLLVEGATSTLRRAASDFSDARLAGPEYLGPVTADGSRVVQMVDPGRLLTPEVRARLFRDASEALR
jgi:chemotaxis-related protein WspB